MKKISEHEATLTEGKANKPDLPTCNIPESDDRASLSKLLGITWDSRADEFMFRLNDLKVIDKSNVSKRSLLRITASIFDALGFLSPFVIRLKILFLTLCINIDWDEALSGDHLAAWTSLMTEFQLLSACRVKRCYYDIGSEVTEVELHGFCDASEQAYSAVLYLRSVYVDGHVSIRLIVLKPG